MLKITICTGPKELRFKLEGKIAGPWVQTLEKTWEEVTCRSGATSKVVDLSGVTFIDSEGRKILDRLADIGAQLEGGNLMTDYIVQEIYSQHRKQQKSRWHEQASKKIIGFIVLLLLPSMFGRRFLYGEERPPLRLTLSQAVAMSLKQNPQVQVASLNVAQSEQDRWVARSALLPQASLDVFDRAVRLNLEAFIGRPFPGIPQHAGPFQVFQAGPDFSMPIFDLTLWRRYQSSYQNVRATEAQHTTVREQVVLLVVSQYLGGLRAGAAVAAAQSRVDLAQALYDQAADLQKEGVGTGLDTLRANVELQNEKQRLIVAETQQKVSLYGLVRLLNLPPDQSVELADKPSFFETPALEVGPSLERAFETRPEMKALLARERGVRLEKRAASESRLPKLEVGGGWAYQGLSAPSAIPSYQYQATVTFPLFTGGRTRAEMTRADLELKKVAQQEDELRNQIALEVKTAIAQMESARHEVDVANLGVKLAQEEVSQARDRFQAGVANNIEVTTAQDALARANDNQIGALYRFNQARADLAHSVGQIEALYGK